MNNRFTVELTDDGNTLHVKDGKRAVGVIRYLRGGGSLLATSRRCVTNDLIRCDTLREAFEVATEGEV